MKFATTNPYTGEVVKTFPAATETEDDTPEFGSTTPETYLGTTKVVNYAGDEKYSAQTAKFTIPARLDKDSFALNGEWTLGTQSISTESGGSITLNYTGQEIRAVLSGAGDVSYTVNGESKSFTVSGTPQSYPLLVSDRSGSGTITVTLPKGVEAFSFTFG